MSYSVAVTAVANGVEAWKVLIDLNKQIDLVLTEVVMPYLSGVGLLSKIMNHAPRKNIPVISEYLSCFHQKYHQPYYSLSPATPNIFSLQ